MKEKNVHPLLSSHSVTCIHHSCWLKVPPSWRLPPHAAELRQVVLSKKPNSHSIRSSDNSLASKAVFEKSRQYPSFHIPNKGTKSLLNLNQYRFCKFAHINFGKDWSREFSCVVVHRFEIYAACFPQNLLLMQKIKTFPGESEFDEIRNFGLFWLWSFINP